MSGDQMNDKQFQNILVQALTNFPQLYRIAPSDWLTKSHTTISQIRKFNEERKDHFRLNMPLALWCAGNPQQDLVAKSTCEGMLRKIERFLVNHGSMEKASKKISDLFGKDWNLSDTRFMSTLSEICLIELLRLKEMQILDFDASMEGSESNADIKLIWEGKEVYLDVKSPTLTGDVLDADSFRDNFKRLSEKAFFQKFSKHSTKNVYRCLAYIYKYSEDFSCLFQHGGVHLKHHEITHRNGDPGFAMIFWLKSVVSGQGGREVVLLDYQYSEQQLLADLGSEFVAPKTTTR